jgi:crossover junction endodeoxyribonuclease RusA
MIRLTLPWPPSINRYWRHVFRGKNAGQIYITAEGKAFRAAVAQIVMLKRARLKNAGRACRVEIVAYPPDRRKRDIDNLQKATLDALTYAGVWHDDSQVDDLRIKRARDAQGNLITGSKVEVTIA